MRLLLKLLALLILGPLVLAVLLVLAIFAYVGLQILWEETVARLTAPPDAGATKS